MSLTICITWIVFNKITWKHKFLVIFQSICRVIQSTYQTPHTFIKYGPEHHSFVREKDCDFPFLLLLEIQSRSVLFSLNQPRKVTCRESVIFPGISLWLSVTALSWTGPCEPWKPRWCFYLQLHLYDLQFWLTKCMETVPL